jgi:hypothetical protein
MSQDLLETDRSKIPVLEFLEAAMARFDPEPPHDDDLYDRS